VPAHFNHSGSSLPTQATLAAVTEHLQREARHGGMEAAAAVAAQVQDARIDAARLLGAAPEEIAFMTSGSAAFGLAFAALPRLAAGDRILVGRQEWVVEADALADVILRERALDAARAGVIASNLLMRPLRFEERVERVAELKMADGVQVPAVRLGQNRQ